MVMSTLLAARFSPTGNGCFQKFSTLERKNLLQLVILNNSSKAPKISVIGPLLMQPAALDNYGGDACSLLCLPVSPPVLVIADRTGNIHHAVLLPRAATDDSDDSDANPNIADDLEVVYVFCF